MSKTDTLPPVDHAASLPDVRALDRSLFSGIAWTGAFRWAAQVISWAATLYVARLLVPGDYGLVAMATIPIGLARMVEDLGLDSVIVQNRTLNKEQLSQLAGAALLLSAVLASLFIGLSGPISRYFREPAVAMLISALSLTFFADALQILPRALLQQDLRFRALAFINALQLAIAAVVLVVCAALGLGYLSLVINSLVSVWATTVILYLLRPFKIAWPRELKTLVRPLMAGWRMIVSRASYYAYDNTDATFIGRLQGKDALGAFGFAMTFAAMPVTEVTTLVSKVVPGVFSAVQSSQPTLRRYFLLLTEAVSYLTLPMSFGLALTADDFVLLALGDKWLAVVAPLRLLCIYMSMYSCQALVSHVLLWTGHFRANMWCNVFALVVLPPCFYIGAHYGIAGVGWAWVIGFPLSLVPSFVMMFRILDMSWSAYRNSLMPALTGCLVMIAAVLLVRQVLPASWPHAARLGIQAAVGAVAYVSVMLGLFRSRVLQMYGTIREARMSPGVLPVSSSL